MCVPRLRNGFQRRTSFTIERQSALVKKVPPDVQQPADTARVIFVRRPNKEPFAVLVHRRVVVDAAPHPVVPIRPIEFQTEFFGDCPGACVNLAQVEFFVPPGPPQFQNDDIQLNFRIPDIVLLFSRQLNVSIETRVPAAEFIVLISAIDLPFFAKHLFIKVWEITVWLDKVVACKETFECGPAVLYRSRVPAASNDGFKPVVFRLSRSCQVRRADDAGRGSATLLIPMGFRLENGRSLIHSFSLTRQFKEAYFLAKCCGCGSRQAG